MREARLRTAVIVAALLGAGGGRADDSPALPPPTIPWQDPAAFALPFLQLPFDAPEPVRPGTLELSVRTIYSSTIAKAQSPTTSIDVDLETAQPILEVRWGFMSGAELDAAIPGAIDYAGFMTKPIRWVESLFDAVNPLRLGAPPRQGRLVVTRAGGASAEWVGTVGSVGDLRLGAKVRIRDQAGGLPALSWRTALTLPTAALPFGSGSVQAGGGLLAGWTFGETALRLAADVATPAGDFTAARLHTRPHGDLQLGLSQRLAPWASVVLQGSAHTSAIVGTGLSVIEGPTFYALAGAIFEPARSVSISLGLVENVFANTRGADFSGLLDLAWRN
ncbi:MAG TPA: hypothetical protein VML50_02200 [Anaeromyxobacter sp.]|nr:hypothetical protein [Anaeromyxobacter sp.]